MNPRESDNAFPAAGPAVTGQGDYTPEEAAFAEASLKYRRRET